MSQSSNIFLRKPKKYYYLLIFCKINIVSPLIIALFSQKEYLRIFFFSFTYKIKAVYLSINSFYTLFFTIFFRFLTFSLLLPLQMLLISLQFGCHYSF